MQVTLKKAVKDFIDKMIVGSTTEWSDGKCSHTIKFRKGYRLSSGFIRESQSYIASTYREELEEYLAIFVKEINLTEFSNLREINEMEQEEKCK